MLVIELAVLLYLSNEIEEKIRNLAYERFGRRKGVLSILAKQIFRGYLRKLRGREYARNLFTKNVEL